MDGSKDLVSNDPSKKLNLGQNSEEGLEDRITNLPESLICHIFSYLYTHDVVRTCVLSTEWNYMWTNVTTLRFHDRFFLTGNEIDKSYFMKFVEKTLLLGSPVIEDFFLDCTTGYDLSRLQSWISTVVKRNVRKIGISHMEGEAMVLPRCLLNSGSLIELTLLMPCIINVPSSICFSNLKILWLSSVTCLNVYSSLSCEIQFTFPFLEELHIHGSFWQKVKVVNFDAPELTIFSFSNRYDPGTSLAAVKLHRSRLAKFYYGGYGLVDYILPNPSSIINASFGCSVHDNIDKRRRMHSLMFTLLQQFSSLNYLSLSYKIIKAIADLQGRLPTMDKVINLRIVKETPALDKAFIALLQSLPVLQTLVIIWGTEQFDEDEMVPKVVPSCLKSRLKLLEIKNYDGTNNGLELTKFLLKNAMVLEEVNITVNTDRSESEFRAIKKKFPTFPRGSDQVSITVNPRYY